MRTNWMILARSVGASILICSGVIERTLTNMAYKLRITSSLNDVVEMIVPSGLQVGSVGVVVME